ncbi:MAG: hypothetical protein R3A79_07375 [Nannocystaceae bacterium]
MLNLFSPSSPPRTRLLLALVLPLAACAGDDAGTSATTQATTSEATTASSSTTATGSGSDSDSATTTATGTGTDSATGSTSGTTTGDAGPECVVDADCQLVDNCCECSSLPSDDEPDACDFDCLVSECTSQGLDSLTAACRSGICELTSTIHCEGPVACDQEPPACEGDAVPSVIGECWGPCVPLHYCADSSSCSPGCGDGWVCVESQSGGPGGCAPLPAACDGAPSCDCFSPYWDEVCAGSCSESGAGLLCEDGG